MRTLIENLIIKPSKDNLFELFVQDVFVGNIRFFIHMDSAEIVYDVNEKWRNKGIATEAVNIILKKIFDDNIKVVWADVFCDNISSRRVLEKAGFIEDKRMSYRKVFDKKELKDYMRFQRIKIGLV